MADVEKLYVDGLYNITDPTARAAATAAQAEVSDIRVGTNGVTYPSAGDAVREQVGLYSLSLSSVKLYPELLEETYIKGSDGSLVSNDGFACTQPLLDGAGKLAGVALGGGIDNTYEFYLSYFAADGTYLGYSALSSAYKYVPLAAKKLGITFRRLDRTALRTADVTTIRNNILFDVITDTSLSKYGKAADAKTTGDRIAEVAAATSFEINKVDFATIPKMYINASGDMLPATVYNCTDYIRIDMYKVLQYKRIGLTGTAPTIYMSFYDKNKTAIGGQRAAARQPQRDYVGTLEPLIVPAGAVYARFSQFSDVETYGEFELYGSSIANTVNLATNAYAARDDVTLVKTFDGVVALFDELTEKYGSYVTKNTLTKESETLYEYVFASKNYNSQGGQRSQNPEINKPTVLITSGVHGDEQSSVMSLYGLCRSLCENKFPLTDILNYITLRVIPIVSPSAYDLDSRLNSHSVNINRNFASTNWELTPAGSNYSGAAPGDQLETQIIQEWMTAHNTAALYIDWHNSAYVNEISCFLGTQTSAEAKRLKRLYLLGINQIVPYWQKIRNLDNSNIYAYTGGGNPGSTPASGTSASYAADQGLLAFTIETSWDIADTGRHSNFTIGTGEEAMAGLLNGLRPYFDDLVMNGD